MCSKLLAAALLLHGVPEIGGATLGVPMLRVIIYWGLSWAPPFMEANK